MQCAAVQNSRTTIRVKIQLRFDDRFPAPNLKQSWNIAPIDPMLTAVRGPDMAQTNISEAELVALRLLTHRPNATAIPGRTMSSLIEKGLIKRHAGSLIVTSRGHAES